MSIFVNRYELISIKNCIMIKVKKILLSKLLNLEVRVLQRELIKTLEKFDLDELRLHDMYDLLVKQSVEADSFKTPYGKHHLTSKLARLHKKRLNYASLINMQVKSLVNVDDKETQRFAKAAKVLTGKTLTYLGRMNIHAVEEAIERFFYTLETDKYATAREAFVHLGLQHYLDELKKTNIAYFKLYYQRKKDLKERPKTGDPVVKRETLNLMRMFFDQVNSNQRIYKDIDFEMLINELNGILTGYSKSIKTRIATNKRRARKKVEAEKTAAANVAKPVSVKEVAPSVIVETKTAKGIAVVASTTGATTTEEHRNPQLTNSHKGTKAKEIPVKDLMKVVKRKRKGRR